MKKIALIAMTAMAAIATPAAAQTVTGTINLTGVVGPKCFVVPGNGNTFGETVNFGALDAADGTLRPGLATDFATRSATVKCTSANPSVSVTASPLATGGAAPTGYANTINYTASVAVDATGLNNGPFSDASGGAGSGALSVGSPLANTTGNVRITTSGYGTANATDLLVAGTYNGSIVVVISPN
jgi:hypothetical protein